MIAVCGDYKLREFLRIAPLLVIPLRTTYHILQFITLIGKRPQILNGEDLIESLFECLNLDLDRLVEQVVHG